MIFRYYNRRPDGDEREDCVVRAISTATNLKYEAVNNLLKLSAEYNSCDKLCVCCYHHLLEDILCYKAYDANSKTVKEIVDDFEEYIILLRMEGHLSCAIRGNLLDIWDCSDRVVDCFWLII